MAGKDMQQRIVSVAAGHDHPALLTPTAALREAHWIAGQAPEEMRRAGSMECSFKARRGICFRSSQPLHGQQCMAMRNLIFAVTWCAALQ